MITYFCIKTMNTSPVALHTRDHLVVTIGLGGSGSSG